MPELYMKGVTPLGPRTFYFDRWEETVRHRADLRRVREEALSAEGGIFGIMVANILTLARPGRDLAMQKYRAIWRSQASVGCDRTEGELEQKMTEEMLAKGESMAAIHKRLKRRFNTAMNNRFGSMAMWLYLEWGFVDRSVKAAMAEAVRERREDIPTHGGTPGSAGGHADAVEAAKARRKVKNVENQAARWEAATQEGGTCEGAGCSSNRWWHHRRTQCVHCGKKVGECCQASVGSVASWHAAAITWHLVCKPCEATKGLEGPVARAIDISLPRPEHCAYHPGAPRPSEHKCFRCNRWLCSACIRPAGPPHECRVCPEAF